MVFKQIGRSAFEPLAQLRGRHDLNRLSDLPSRFGGSALAFPGLLNTVALNPSRVNKLGQRR